MVTDARPGVAPEARDSYTHRTMSEPARAPRPTASVEQRVDAIQSVLHERGMEPDEFIVQANHAVEEKWVPENGARVVAKAWTDPGVPRPPARRRQGRRRRAGLRDAAPPPPPVVLENTATVHNVICCTLCSCTAFTIVGLPPDWYKDLEYRARVVRESRTVLREMGLDLPAEIEIRVWDTTADTRYMVLPRGPPAHRRLERGAPRRDRHAAMR